VFNHLKLPGCHPVLHHGGGVNRRIVPMKPPVPGRHLRPLLPEYLQELAQGLHDVVGVHCGAFELVVGLDEALRIEEGQDHLFGHGRMDFGIYRSRLTLHKPLLALLLSLGRVERNRGLIYGDDPSQHHHGVAAEHWHEGLTGPHPLVFHLLIQELGDPSGGLF
jgi:hypothetical protein